MILSSPSIRADATQNQGQYFKLFKCSDSSDDALADEGQVEEDNGARIVSILIRTAG